MKRRGSEIRKEYFDNLRAHRDAQDVITRCAFCRRVHRGTLASGREWHQTHRRDRHPNLPPIPTRRRNARDTTMISGQDIDTNIAAVRAQGGGAWVA